MVIVAADFEAPGDEDIAAKVRLLMLVHKAQFALAACSAARANGKRRLERC